MKKKLLLLLTLATLLAALAVPTGCQKVHDVDWPEVAQCGPGISDLIGVVSRVLLAGEVNWKDELTRLAETHGTETVICVVDRLRADWAGAAAASTPERQAALDRAEEFIGFTGSRVVNTEDEPKAEPPSDAGE